MSHSQNIINCFRTTLKVIKTWDYLTGNYMFKVNNRNPRTKCEIYFKLTLKTPEWQQIYDPFKYLWWNIFGKFPVSSFNLLIVSEMFQPLLVCYCSLCIAPVLQATTSQNVLMNSKFTINQPHVGFTTKNCKRHKVGQLQVG